MENITSVTQILTEKKWTQIFEDKDFVQNLLAKIIPNYTQKCRWFAGKSKKIKNFRVQHLLTFPVEKSVIYMVLLEANYQNAHSETYFLPLYFTLEDVKKIDKKAIIASLQVQKEQGTLIDAIYDEKCRKAFFEHIVKQKNVQVADGILEFGRGSVLADFPLNDLQSYVLKADQSNTSIIYNERFFLKIYRKLFRETNPDYEITRFLTENKFKNSPAFAGSITWKRDNSFDVSFGLMQEKVENEGDAWTFSQILLKKYFEKILKNEDVLPKISDLKLYEPCGIRAFKDEVINLVDYNTLQMVEKLAQRTAEMHIAISADKSNYIFRPVLYNHDYVVWLKNRLIAQLDNRIDLIEKNIDNLENDAQVFANTVLDNKEEITNTILNFDEERLISKRIRIHGDYHLGQVLKKGDDFIILDFEGEPESSIRDRKVKQPPLKDVAGMLRSFHYAVYSNIFEAEKNNPTKKARIQEAGQLFYHCITSIFLNAYIKTAMENSLDIGYQSEINYVLRYHLLEKAIYELGYELNSRPAWAIIPLKGIMDLLG